MTEKAASRVRVSEPRCPYCHEEILRGQEPVGCPSCHAAHHEACLTERPACSACNAPHPRFAGGPFRVPRRRAGRPATVLGGLAYDMSEVGAFIWRVLWSATGLFRWIGRIVLNLGVLAVRDAWARVFLGLTVCGATMILLALFLELAAR